MTTLFTAIFYLWLVLSILLAAMWFLREQDRRRKDQQENELAEELLTTAQEPVAGPASASESNPEVKGETGPDPDPAPEPEPEPEPQAASTDEAEAEAGAEPVEGQAATELPGILDMLDGITLPHELTPLTARIEDPNRHAIFVSPNPDAAEVGTAFADELVERGFEIEAAGFDQATATRGSDVFSMRISPDAGSVADGNRLRYPTAQESDVAIEIWLGNGSPPALAD